jgi:hypothetical protein
VAPTGHLANTWSTVTLSGYLAAGYSVAPGSGRGLRKVRFLVRGESTQAGSEPKVAQLPSQSGLPAGLGFRTILGKRFVASVQQIASRDLKDPQHWLVSY